MIIMGQMMEVAQAVPQLLQHTNQTLGKVAVTISNWHIARIQQ